MFRRGYSSLCPPRLKVEPRNGRGEFVDGAALFAGVDNQTGLNFITVCFFQRLESPGIVAMQKRGAFHLHRIKEAIPFEKQVDFGSSRGPPMPGQWGERERAGLRLILILLLIVIVIPPRPREEKSLATDHADGR